jgi:photosystem II stability/assembly factor-like uncharacterized protein
MNEGKGAAMSNHYDTSMIRHLIRYFAFFSLICCAAYPFLLQAQEKDEGEGEEIIARQRFFYERRAGGPGRILPEDFYERSLAERERMVARLRSPQSVQLTGTWESVNPVGMFYARTGNNYISGRTNSIAFHPTDPLTIYIGAAGGGVWKTTDGGVQWRVLTDSLSAVTCGGIAVDPNNPDVIYYGSGELNFSLDSYYGDGIFRSTNGGATWLRSATAGVGRYFSQVSIDPTNSAIVYASGSNGVYKTTDAGFTWRATNSGNNANCILIDPTNTQILYTTTGGSGGNLTRKSTDGGTTWFTLGGGLPGSGTAGRTQLAMAPGNSSILYASIASQSTSGLLGLYRTTDAGATWTLQNATTNYLGAQGWYDNVVAVHPTNPDFVLVGGLDVYTSSNAGVTLTQRTQWATSTSTNMSHADIHYLGYNNGILYCGSDGGVYQSTNDGILWTDLNATISTLQFQSADYDPTDPLKLYGGTQDNNLETSTDGGATWIQRTTGDGGYSIVDPVTPNYVYGQYVNGSLKRSNNYGVSFTEISPNSSSGGLFYNPYEMAPTDHNVIVYGQADLWKTTSVQTATSTSGWTQIASSGTVGGNVSAIAIAGNPNKIYAGTNNGRIMVTGDNGADWLTRTGFQYIGDLFVDDVDDNVCYAGVAGTAAGQHVFKTVDGGNTWQNITGDLPNTPVNSIVVRTAAPRIIFVGTDIGVFQSTNDGTSWLPFNNGFPAVAVFDLKYKERANILLAATHGRGNFMYYDLPPLPTIRMAVSASNIDFGLVEALHNSDTLAVTMENRGVDTLVISSFANARSEFQLLNIPTLPLRLASQARATVRVLFRPTLHAAITDTIQIVSNDPNNASVRVTLKGKGVMIGRAQPGVLYATSLTQTSGSQLYRIDPVSGAATAVGPTGITEIDGLAIRPDRAEIYGTLANAAATQIFRVSEQYGDALIVKTIAIPNLRSIAFASDNTLYGGTTTGRLYRINPATGDTTYIGTSGLAYSGLVFHPGTGDLWASVRPPLTNRDRIYKVSTTTGAATLVGSTGDAAITPSLAFDAAGTLFGLKGSASQINTIIRIDTATGVGTLVGSTGVTGLLAIAMRSDSLMDVAPDRKPGIPATFSLHQNYPNPFNPTTEIQYDLPVADRVQLTVFDIVGREVALLVDEEQQPGFKTVQFNAQQLASGVYFYRLTAGTFVATKKMTIVK